MDPTSAKRAASTSAIAKELGFAQLRQLGYWLPDDWIPPLGKGRNPLPVMTPGGQQFQVRIHGLSNGTSFVAGQRQPYNSLLYYILVDVPHKRFFVLPQDELDHLCDRYRGCTVGTVAHAEERWGILP
jgi:hypothetical protein